MRRIRSGLLASAVLVIATGPVAADVVGVGNFSHVVSDLERAAAFYGDVLGLDAGQTMDWSPNPAIMQLGNTPGAQSRIATFTIPGAAFGIELIEYKDIARGHAQIRFQDPGASVLQLRVRDLDPVLARLESSAGRIWTPTGEPIVVSDTMRIIFLQDPDGIFVELIESSEAPPGEGNVYGATVEFIIEDSAATAAFYRAAFGAEPEVAESFDDTPALNANVATNGAAFRRTRLQIPGTALDIAMLEFRDIYRKPLNTKVQDPGTAILQLHVDDVAAMTQQLVDAGGTLITTGGGPVELFPGVLLALVRDPNNLYLELLPPR